jgi:DNA-binding transcriptional LysR family regulator
MDAAHQEMMELQSGLRGRVAVGTVLTPSSGLVTDAIILLKSRVARLQVSVSVDTSKLLVERLRAGELDIVVGRILDTGLAAELNFEPITDEPHSLIAAAGHPLAGRSDLQLAELAGVPWVLPPAGSILRDRLTAMFLAQGLEPPAEIVETMALPVVASLLTGSRMVAALPEELVRPYLDAGLLTVLPFDLGLRMDLYGIITRKQHRLSPGAESMLATLREVAATRYPR